MCGVLLQVGSLAPTAETTRPARIESRVTGERRLPLQGARVGLRPADGAAAITRLTGASGECSFDHVQPGAYRVEVAFEQRHAAMREPVRFEAGETYTLDLPLWAEGDSE